MILGFRSGDVWVRMAQVEHPSDILNRMFEWTPHGLRYEADPRHAERVVSQLGLGPKSSPLTTPGTRGNPTGKDIDNLREAEDAKAYRRLAARANVLAQDV